MTLAGCCCAGCFEPHSQTNDPQAILAELSTEDPVYTTTPGLEDGLVIVLHGIQGQDEANQSIRAGLLMGGVDRAVSLLNWGSRVPLAGMVINQVNVVGNRIDGRKIADVVVAYQHRYPGRTVHLVGHSGGAGVAVFAVEHLPPGHRVDGLVLLSGSLSASYDLTEALRHTTYGILNVYNRNDGGLLGVGTTMMGNVDGVRGPSAGLRGFTRPTGELTPETLRLYQRLFQLDATDVLPGGLAGTHFATTDRDFIRTTVAPWLLSCSWPAVHATIAANLSAKVAGSR